MARRTLALACAATLGVIALATTGDAAGPHASAGVRLHLVGRFAAPTYLTAPPGDRRRRFVVERAGRIRVILGSRKLKAPFLDIRGRVQTGGESGLLSMAFAPDYATSRRFYVYYTDHAGSIRVEQYLRSLSTPKSAGRTVRCHLGCK